MNMSKRFTFYMPQLTWHFDYLLGSIGDITKRHISNKIYT